MGTKRSTAKGCRSVANVLRMDITTETVLRLFPSIRYAGVSTNHLVETALAETTLAEIAQLPTYNVMNKFQILQLNVRKKVEIQHSLLNNEDLKEFSILAISELHSQRNRETVIVAPMGHHN